jgi:A/G-specific adenine glycosylase
MIPPTLRADHSRHVLTPDQFQHRVLNWFDLHGRHDLPWQQAIDPYRVWVSEIMLQQTQVKTVIPYFDRFMATFPTVEALATAGQDQVLHLWTGLGYYARARNLHRTAQLVSSEHKGLFPADLDALSELPGIGRSTAGAIRSIAFRQPAAILDGNVKRVLARYAAIEGWPGQSAVHKRLWELTEQLTPGARVWDYNQAMMDLGATVCTRTRPLCEACPLAGTCRARQHNSQANYPGRKPRKAMPVKATTMLMVLNPHREVYLQKRPASGIWGGLWSFPEVESSTLAGAYCLDNFACSTLEIDAWDTLRHTFSHYHLDIEPTVVRLDTAPQQVMEDGTGLWYNSARPESVGLAAPVARLLKLLENLR